MDYDQTNMPENYDRGRKQADGVLEMWMERLQAAVCGRRIASIIDLGCGTGRFSEALANTFNATVIGVDPSQKMLARAQPKAMPTRVSFVSGSAEDIPCEHASADLIFSSMAFHHYRSKDNAARECHRVLKPSGLVCIRNSTRGRSSPYGAYFPNYEATLSNLPSVDEIVAPLARNRFSLIRHDVVPHMMALNAKDLAEKAAFRADSTLQRLSDDDFATGLAKLRAARDAVPAMIDIDLLTFEAAT